MLRSFSLSPPYEKSSQPSATSTVRFLPGSSTNYSNNLPVVPLRSAKTRSLCLCVYYNRLTSISRLAAVLKFGSFSHYVDSWPSSLQEVHFLTTTLKLASLSFYSVFSISYRHTCFCYLQPTAFFLFLPQHQYISPYHGLLCVLQLQL